MKILMAALLLIPTLGFGFPLMDQVAIHKMIQTATDDGQTDPVTEPSCPSFAGKWAGVCKYSGQIPEEQTMSVEIGQFGCDTIHFGTSYFYIGGQNTSTGTSDKYTSTSITMLDWADQKLVMSSSYTGRVLGQRIIYVGKATAEVFLDDAGKLQMISEMVLGTEVIKSKCELSLQE